MKPLEKSRQSLKWMGIHFAEDEDGIVIGQRKFAQKTFSNAFAITFIVIAIVHVISIIKLQFTNPERFFFVLQQFMITVHASTAFITIYFFGPRISTVFENLSEIYEKCKQ